MIASNVKWNRSGQKKNKKKKNNKRRCYQITIIFSTYQTTIVVFCRKKHQIMYSNSAPSLYTTVTQH